MHRFVHGFVSALAFIACAREYVAAPSGPRVATRDEVRSPVAREQAPILPGGMAQVASLGAPADQPGALHLRLLGSAQGNVPSWTLDTLDAIWRVVTGARPGEERRPLERLHVQPLLGCRASPNDYGPGYWWGPPYWYDPSYDGLCIVPRVYVGGPLVIRRWEHSVHFHHPDGRGG